jgi:hypothetical protein
MWSSSAAASWARFRPEARDVAQLILDGRARLCST